MSSYQKLDTLNTESKRLQTAENHVLSESVRGDRAERSVESDEDGKKDEKETRIALLTDKFSKLSAAYSNSKAIDAAQLVHPHTQRANLGTGSFGHPVEWKQSWNPVPITHQNYSFLLEKYRLWVYKLEIACGIQPWHPRDWNNGRPVSDISIQVDNLKDMVHFLDISLPGDIKHALDETIRLRETVHAGCVKRGADKVSNRRHKHFVEVLEEVRDKWEAIAKHNPRVST